MSSSEETLIGHYAPLVRRLALQLAARLPSSVELDDLMQAGMMGLLDAVRRYQDTGEARFETYAVTRIRGAMLDELRAQDWLPRSTRTKARQIELAIQVLGHRLLRAPTEAEIAEALELTLPQYHQLLEDAQGIQVLHYEDLAGTEGGEVPATASLNPESASALRANPLDLLTTAGLRNALVQAINALPERERLLLSLQFEQDLNQKEIAAVMGVTEGRISQLRSQAIARIRAALGDNYGTPSGELPTALLQAIS